MKLHLRIWRQQNSQAEGHFGEYDLDGVREDMSFLEMLDVLNEQLIDSGNEPVAFDSDCVRWLSTAKPTVRLPEPPPANFTCAIIRTGTRLRSSRGGPPHFRWFAI